MRLIVKNHYRYDDIVCYDINQKKFVEDSGLLAKYSSGASRLNGFFAILNKKMILLYRTDALYLEIDSIHFPFNELTIVTADVHKDITDGVIRQTRHIRIAHKEHVIYETDYDDIELTFVFDLTPCIEDEDFDFGLFLEKLTHDPAYQARLFKENKD